MVQRVARIEERAVGGDDKGVTLLHKFSGATVRMEGDRLVVNNPAKAPVYVYTAAGAVVASDMSGADERVEQLILPMRDGLTLIRKK